MNKKHPISQHFIRLLVLNLILFAAHTATLHLAEMTSYYPLWAIYLFFFFSTFALISLLEFIGKSFPDKTGFAFMGLVMLKGLACVLFLVPSFLSEPKPDFTDVIYFFIPYFVMLTYEAYAAVKMLNS
ncbi:MAG: DUF6168 family protein [Bacteroidota bacterium]